MGLALGTPTTATIPPIEDTIEFLSLFEKGDLEGLTTRLEENPSLSLLLNTATDRLGRTALHLAAMNGHEHMIRRLLLSDDDEKGGGRALGFDNVLAVDYEKLTALHYAVETGHLECCKAIVEGCKAENGEREKMLNAVNESRQTVLHQAAFSGQEHIIDWLLSSQVREQGFNSVGARAFHLNTALIIATQAGNLACCQAIVKGTLVETGERDEMLNATDTNGFTALHLAVAKNHLPIVRWFLSDDGRSLGFNNVLAQSNSGYTIAHLAAFVRDTACFDAVIEGSKIENGEREALLNAVDVNGRNLLHYGCLLPRPHLVSWLLSEEGGRGQGLKSESITAQSNKFETAFHIAAERDSLESLRALLSGCTVGERLRLFLAVDDHGWTAFHYVVRSLQAGIIRELLQNYPETKMIVDARDHRGMTALHRAIARGVDKASRKEWKGFEMAEDRVRVVEALLSSAAGGSTDGEEPAMVDVNLGVKREGGGGEGI